MLSLPRGNGKSTLSGHLVAQALTPDDPLFQPRTESVLMLPASNSAGSSSGWPATSWNPAAGIGSWTRQPGAPSPTLTPGPGCASSDRTARLRWVRLFFVDGPRGFCQRHGKSYLTRRRRGGEGGGGGLLTGRAIPSAYRWAWCRWYSRVVEVPVRAGNVGKVLRVRVRESGGAGWQVRSVPGRGDGRLMMSRRRRMNAAASRPAIVRARARRRRRRRNWRPSPGLVPTRTD